MFGSTESGFSCGSDGARGDAMTLDGRLSSRWGSTHVTCWWTRKRFLASRRPCSSPTSRSASPARISVRRVLTSGTSRRRRSQWKISTGQCWKRGASAAAFVCRTNAIPQSRNSTFGLRNSSIDSVKCRSSCPSRNVGLRCSTRGDDATRKPQNFLRSARRDPCRLSCESFPKMETAADRMTLDATAVRFRMSGTGSSFWGATCRHHLSAARAWTPRGFRKSVLYFQKAFRWIALVPRRACAACPTPACWSTHHHSRHPGSDFPPRRSARVSCDSARPSRSEPPQVRTCCRRTRRCRWFHTGRSSGSPASRVSRRRCSPCRWCHRRSTSCLSIYSPSPVAASATSSIQRFSVSKRFSARTTFASSPPSSPLGSTCSACWRMYFDGRAAHSNRCRTWRMRRRSDLMWCVSTLSSTVCGRTRGFRASRSSSPSSPASPFPTCRL